MSESSILNWIFVRDVKLDVGQTLDTEPWSSPSFTPAFKLAAYL